MGWLMPEYPLEVKVGRKYGAPWLGLNERIEDSAQAPQEAAAGYNFRVGRGVLETRPGITHATDTTRPTSYYATWAANGSVRFPYIDAYEAMNQCERWTWIISFRTPASFPAKGWLFSQACTVGGTAYYQGVYVDSSGKVYVSLIDSAEGDETFDSGANVLSVSTNYVLQVSRYDANAYLYWGKEATSADAESALGTTDTLGETDHPVSSAEHEFVLGAKWNGAAYSEQLAMSCSEVTILHYFVNHVNFGWTSFADPHDPRCALHCRCEDASGTFTDLSGHGNDSDDENNITYQQTANAFVEESSIVQMVTEFAKEDASRLVTVIDGSILVGSFHV